MTQLQFEQQGEEAWYYCTLQDFNEMIDRYGFDLVFKDLFDARKRRLQGDGVVDRGVVEPGSSGDQRTQ
jgi:hypothetical protein